MIAQRQRWDDAADQFLRDAYGVGPMHEIVAHYGCTRSAVCNRVRALGLSLSRPRQLISDQVLNQLYATHGRYDDQPAPSRQSESEQARSAA